MSKRIRSKKGELNTRLVEAQIGDISVILCYGCYKNRIKCMVWDKSIMKTLTHPVTPYHLMYQLGSFEDAICSDCRRKNTNPNLEPFPLGHIALKANKDKKYRKSMDIMGKVK